MPLCVIPSLRVETSIAGPLATWELSLEGWVRGVNIMVYRETDTVLDTRSKPTPNKDKGKVNGETPLLSASYNTQASYLTHV